MHHLIMIINNGDIYTIINIVEHVHKLLYLVSIDLIQSLSEIQYTLNIADVETVQKSMNLMKKMHKK